MLCAQRTAGWCKAETGACLAGSLAVRPTGETLSRWERNAPPLSGVGIRRVSADLRLSGHEKVSRRVVPRSLAFVSLQFSLQLDEGFFVPEKTSLF